MTFRHSTLFRFVRDWWVTVLMFLFILFFIFTSGFKDLGDGPERLRPRNVEYSDAVVGQFEIDRFL